MNLEDQVCNFELSKHLKELGVKQDSLFIWAQLSPEDWRLIPEEGSRIDEPNSDDVSAFTVGELGEMLPDATPTFRYAFGKKHPNTGWHGKYKDVDFSHYFGKNEAIAETEADARAKILIYLIEKDLVKI